MPNEKGEINKRIEHTTDILQLRKDINDLISRSIITARKKKGGDLVENLKSIRELVNLFTKMNPEPKEEIRYIEITVIDALDGGTYKRIARVGKLGTEGISEEQRKEEEKRDQGVMSGTGEESDTTSQEQVGGGT